MFFGAAPYEPPTTLWHIDAVEWAPSTASSASVSRYSSRVPTTGRVIFRVKRSLESQYFDVTSRSTEITSHAPFIEVSMAKKAKRRGRPPGSKNKASSTSRSPPWMWRSSASISRACARRLRRRSNSNGTSWKGSLLGLAFTATERVARIQAVRWQANLARHAPGSRSQSISEEKYAAKVDRARHDARSGCAMK